MGKNSYLGGSTVINRKGRDKESKIEERDQDFLDPRWLTKKKKKNKTQSPAEQFLHLVIDNELRGARLLAVPKKFKRYLPNVEDNEESIRTWAASHPKYKTLKNKKVK